MTERDQAHIHQILARFDGEAVQKYAAGVKEHGGHLPDKPGAMANLRAEIIDLVIYQDTLAQQLSHVLKLLDGHNYVDGTAALRAILGPSSD